MLLRINYLRLHTYISRICTRIYAHARTTQPLFRNPVFPEIDRGRIFLLWTGVARVFPEKGWTGVALGRMKAFFQREEWTGVGGPARVPVPVRPDSDKRAQESPRRHHLGLLLSYEGKANLSSFYAHPPNYYHFIRLGVHG